MTKISIWGDSVMKGVVFDKTIGRYTYLQDDCITEVTKKFDIVCTNNSKFGMTAPKAFENLKKWLSKTTEKPDFALIELGGNDSDFDWKAIAEDPDSDHLPKTPIDEYRKAMTGIIETLRDNSIEPVLVNLHPIDAVRYLDWITKDGISKSAIMKWLKDVFKIYRFQELYSLTIGKLAQELNVRFIDLRQALLNAGNPSDYLCIDGIHPNEKGHEIMNICLSEYISNYKMSMPVPAV